MTTIGGSLAPGLLIAAPPLGDPNFDRTVVLLATHDKGGALGFVVNRVAPVTLGELLGMAGYPGVADASRVFVGGPVQPSSGWILCLDPELSAEQASVIAVGDRVRVTSSRRSFDAFAEEVSAGLAHERDEKKRVVLLGYSGWGPGQLEGEIAAGAWLPVPLDESVLFDCEPELRWERAAARTGVSLAGMMAMNSAGDA